jgi:predicted O-methyltransferase YrrM
MKRINIKEKLVQIDVALDSIVLGDFDSIAEFTAKRNRRPDEPNYAKYGAFYRSNYERGILIYHLIRKFKLKSFLEVGFGRGYGTMCAAKAMVDNGDDGKVYTIDPNLSEEYVKGLTGIFPHEWFKNINFYCGKSGDVLAGELKDMQVDFAYIDGDHSYAATKLDWELVKDRNWKFVLFDDYHTNPPSPDIECKRLIDEIEFPNKELIIMDRRMFLDERGKSDDEIDYGQVLLTAPGIEVEW